MYPIKLTPSFQDYLWGGMRLKEDFGFEIEEEPTEAPDTEAPATESPTETEATKGGSSSGGCKSTIGMGVAAVATAMAAAVVLKKKED